MAERENAVTFEGGGLTLLGDELKVGAAAPDFTVTGNDLAPVKLGDFKDKVLILSVIPSLDTPVCDAQTRMFNKETGALGEEGAKVLTVSLDLPFAQSRWCGAAGVEHVVTASDYKDHSFGLAYGLRIKELGLLARAVIVVDGGGVVRYIQVLPEVTNEPDYGKALDAAKALL